MAKIPFDIKFRPQIESGEYKVETRDGQSVSILAFDIHFRGMSHMILAEYNECYDYWPFNGRYNKTSPDCNLDLFLITPEPELSEFEAKLWEIMKAEGSPVGPREKFTNDDKKAFHEYSAELLELAKKELCESGEVTDWYAKGKAEALKDLPRWVKVEEGVLLDKYSKYLLYSNGVHYFCCGTTITRDGYMLLVDDLEKLPKEE